MLLLTLYLFMPATVCLFWVIVHLLTASRTDSFRYFVYLFTCCGLYIYSEACHALFADTSIVNTTATLVGQLTGPCIVPFLLLYIGKLLRLSKKDSLHYLWIIIPVVLFTIGALLFFMGGEAKADQLYVFFTDKVYTAVLRIEMLIFVYYSIRLIIHRHRQYGTLWQFFFKKGRISLARAQLYICFIPMSIMTVRIAFAHNLYSLTRWIPLLTATLLMISAFMFGLMAMFGTKESVRWKDMRYLMRFNYGEDNKAAAVEHMMNDLLEEAEEEALKRIQEKIGENLHIDQWKSADSSEETQHQLANQIFSAVSDSWDENSLISRFQHLMMDEQLFLQPKLSLEDVAERLHSNKTYVSKLVNNTYNLGFPELINTLRIDYAEQYIIAHREAKQEEIAQECGFLSASSFNTMFKKVTGMTPKVWIASIDRQKERKADD